MNHDDTLYDSVVTDKDLHNEFFQRHEPMMDVNNNHCMSCTPCLSCDPRATNTTTNQFLQNDIVIDCSPIQAFVGDKYEQDITVYTTDNVIPAIHSVCKKNCARSHFL